MKRFIPCLLLLPLITSCELTEPEYYDAGYYHSVPPRAEIYGFDERPHDYRHPPHHHGFKQPHQESNQATVHGHGKQSDKVNKHAKQSHHKGHTVVKNKDKNKVHGHDKIDIVKKKIGW
ncbi:Uncharacterised protein [Legionella wadsworthii]|uniref:Lipoprotein n=1 Tax=Legionella wadsworthii TaxID=28088 RepID=A0A378LQQ0_9GAMM|nr:hypothetical protein [Legionella wadsworthii]STY28680.1 Uncharacterised protein [Legionella wadsworthii]